MKGWLIVRFVAGVALAVALTVIGLGWYAYAHRYAPGRITFQEYEPTYLPEGKAISDKYILSVYAPSGDPIRYTELALEFSGEHSYMYQRAFTDKEQHNLDTACAAAAKSVGTICARGATPGGRPYILFTTMNTDAVVSQEIDWSRDRTLLLMRLQGGGKQGYSRAVIERMIDACRPTRYDRLPLRTADHSKGI